MPSSSPESSHHAQIRLPTVSGTGSRQHVGGIFGLGPYGGQTLNVAHAGSLMTSTSRAQRATGSKRALRAMQLPGIWWWDGDDPSGKLFGGSADLTGLDLT